MVWLLDLGVRGQSDITCAKRKGVFGDLRVNRFLQSGEEESQYGWCVVSSFASVCLSVSWSFGLRTVGCLLLIWLRCREICLLYRFSLLIGSDWVFFVFYREGHGLAEKNTLFLFFDKFHRHYAMHRNLFFSILKKVSAPITSGECSHGR